MENADILRQLSDPSRSFVQLRSFPAAVIQRINAVWQWDEKTGLPVFEDPNHPARRYVPDSFMTGLDGVGRRFVREMKGDNVTFYLNCSYVSKRKLVVKILLWDFKKIQIQNETEGIRVTKTHANLIEYDELYPCLPLRVSESVTNIKRTIPDLIEEINLNAVRGFTGPGTYPCRHPNCTVSGELMTSSPVVIWGPGPDQRLSTIKRSTCATNNLTYLLHCNACLRQNIWTTYVGESDNSGGGFQHNFHSRINSHIRKFGGWRLSRNYPCDIESIAAIGQGIVQFADPDPDNILQDPFSHFNFVHSPEDRRYTVLDLNYESNGRRKVHEGILIHQFGDCIYNRLSMSGALNLDY